MMEAVREPDAHVESFSTVERGTEKQLHCARRGAKWSVRK